MTHCLSGLLLGALLGAGVELNPAETAKPAAETNQLDVAALNLADAFKDDSRKIERERQKKNRSQKQPSPPAPLKRRVLVFKASWCGTCVLLDREWPAVRKKKLRVGTKASDHFQLFDVDRYPDLMQKHRVGALPTVILMDGNRELARHTYLTADQLVDMYNSK